MTPRSDARCRLSGRFLLPVLAVAATLPASPQSIQFVADAAETVTAGSPPVLPAAPPPASPFNEERILGVMPDYWTVRDSHRFVPALTSRQKWLLAEKETFDPFNIASAFMTAAESQWGNETPKYGQGWANYGRRVGAAQLDFASQNFVSAGVMANLFHQDPRYFRMGPRSRFLNRVGYSLSRLVVARQDSGRETFNVSNFGGMAVGIALSNAYYPSASRTGTVMTGRIWTSLMSGAVGNLMSEFWPDVQQKFFHHR